MNIKISEAEYSDVLHALATAANHVNTEAVAERMEYLYDRLDDEYGDGE